MNKIHSFMHRLHSQNAASLFLRIALGVVFINAGLLKFQYMDMTVAGFAAAGIPAALAHFVAYVELIGGILLLVGIFVRYVGIILAIVMFVAFAKVHFVNGFGLQNGGYEYVFVLFFGALSLVALGAGKYSLAGLIKKN